MSDAVEARPQRETGAREACDALFAVGLYWLVDAAAQRTFYGAQAEFSFWGVQWALAHTALLLGGLAVVALVAGRTDVFPRLVTWTFRLGCLINPVAWAFTAWHGPFERQVDWYLFVFAQILPQIPMIRWVLGRHSKPAFRRKLSGTGYGGAVLLSTALLTFDPMFYDPEDEDYDSGYAQLDVEALYTAQDRLLSHQIAGLAPERPGQPDVCAILVGGTSYQSVFRSEVEQVGPILNMQYGSGPRTLRLVNSETDPMRYPLANRANLEAALQAVETRSGPEDLLFLFMTSHGAEDVFSLSFYQAGTTDLTAADFAAMLARTRTGPAVIVLSACHAGSFIDDMKAADRLVIAAARADRTSFGCEDGRDWTEFGRSFFDLALRADPDPRTAFLTAVKDVRRMEFWALRRASLPQISEGAEIGPILDRLLMATGPTQE